MDEEDRAEDVDDIEDDDKELVKRVKDRASMSSNEKVSLDKKWKEGKNFEIAGPLVCAVLVKKDSAAGAVRVYSDPVTNVVTGPKQKGVVHIVLKNNESCRLFGSPSVRWFRRVQNITN